MKKVFLVLTIAAVVCLLAGRICFAADPLGKLGRGVANVTTGWMDVFMEMGKESEERGYLGAVLVGPIKGLVKAVQRTAVGVYEVVTFPVKPSGPIIEPEFVWQRDQ